MITVVTGASGHVGNTLVRALLAQGRRVRVLVHHNTTSLDGLDVERVMGDVADAASLNRAFKDADTVYHLAAVISIDDNCWDEIEPVNVRGVQNMVSACLENGVRRLVHFSSIHAINQRPFDSPVDESRPYAGESHPPYDRSKAAGERAVRRGIEQGLNAVIVAPTGIIGPNDYQPSHTGQLLLSMAQGKLPALVEGGFDWVDVRDVVMGAMLAEQKAPSGAKYILSGHWGSVSELANLVSQATGVRPPAFVSPLWLARAGVPFMTAYEKLSHRRPLYTRASMRAVCSNPKTSHALATKELDYQPRPLAETINDTIAWFRHHGYLAESTKS
jgi:dihydroflavonol-4-reductase